jgi:hypothetical protein
LGWNISPVKKYIRTFKHYILIVWIVDWFPTFLKFCEITALSTLLIMFKSSNVFFYRTYISTQRLFLFIQSRQLKWKWNKIYWFKKKDWNKEKVKFNEKLINIHCICCDLIKEKKIISEISHAIFS